MGRKNSKADIESIIGRLRGHIPDIAIRSTLICGFPGEDDKKHEELLNFISDMKFDRLGAFSYSKEDGTPAASFEHQVDDDVKNAWRDEVMALQQKISLSKNEEMVGKIVSCFVEGRVEDGVYVGRTYRDAPDVDGYIFIGSDKEFISGDLISVKVTGFKEYDLIGDYYEFAE